MSFSIRPTTMVDKNMSILSEKCSDELKKRENYNFIQTLICFTPKNASGNVTLLKESLNDKKTMTTDKGLATIPENSVIDSIEFYGAALKVTGSFSIGLGQLNSVSTVRLIENTTQAIAVERQGGCRTFTFNNATGENNRVVSVLQSFVNIELEHPITEGYICVVVRYHAIPWA